MYQKGKAQERQNRIRRLVIMVVVEVEGEAYCRQGLGAEIRDFHRKS
jgi:hypothetical protein